MTFPTNSFKRIVVSVALSAAAVVQAQVPRPQMPALPAKPPAPAMPNKVDIDAMMRQQQQRMANDLDSASQQLGAPGSPRGGVFMPPVNVNNGEVDIEKLASMYTELKAQAEAEDTPKLIVFVSLSIPKASLLRIGQQASKANAVVAVRGMRYGLGKGMAKSLEALKPLIETGADVQVHPELFERYNIRVVPTVVVATDPDPGCSQDSCAAKSVAISGDASLDYILDHVAQRKDAIGQLAQERLKRLIQK